MELAADPLAMEAPRPPFMAPIPVKQRQVNVLSTHRSNRLQHAEKKKVLEAAENMFDHKGAEKQTFTNSLLYVKLHFLISY